MKIGIYTPHTTTNITEHPAEFRPIGFCRDRYEITGDFDEADWVYFYLDYLNCNQEYDELRKTKTFQKYKHKGILYAMHDTPTFAYLDPEPLKFIAQPLYDPLTNKETNIVSIPLQMRHIEYQFIKNRKFINELRQTPKEYDFCFVGQTRYMGRHAFRPENLGLPAKAKYLFEETRPIWQVQNISERVKLTEEFCLKLAKARFCFCPRGVGSSSFRTFQSLMSGTIPIIYGMKDKPFSDDLDWNKFSFDGERVSVNEIMGRYDTNMKQRAEQVWGSYFHMEKTDQYIFDRYLEKKRNSS